MEQEIYDSVSKLLQSLQLRVRLHPLNIVNVSNDSRIANKIISHFPVNSLQELSYVVYAVATVVSTKNGFQPRSEGTQPDVTPAWKIRL